MVDLPKTDSADYFADIANDLMDKHEELKLGEMMNNPGLKCKGRNFAVFLVEQDKVVFRVGKEFDVDAVGLTTWSHFNPSADKPPMTDWVVVEFADKDKWVGLLEQSLTVIRAEISKV